MSRSNYTPEFKAKIVIEVLQCTPDIHPIVSTHVESVALLSRVEK